MDAKNQILGRLSSKVAQKLIGKHKPYFAPHLDCGDYVVIVNSDQIKVTGTKLQKKRYYRHSGYPGGLKQQTLAKFLEKDSTKVIELAVKNMLPKNKLRSRRLNRLKIFANNQHPYEEKLIPDKK